MWRVRGTLLRIIHVEAHRYTAPHARWLVSGLCQARHRAWLPFVRYATGWTDAAADAFDAHMDICKANGHGSRNKQLLALVTIAVLLVLVLWQL